jgi:6-phosphogluconolactonase (cycloisomerase 2 family)
VPTLLSTVGPSNSLEGVTSIDLSPDGEHLYACGRNFGTLAVFDRDDTTGALTEIQVLTDGSGGVDGLDGAQSLVVAPDGAYLYVAARYDDAIAVFARDGSAGTLTTVEVVRDGVGGVAGIAGASDVILSSDGAHLYVAGYEGDSVVVFSRNAGSGELALAQQYADPVGLDGASSVAIDPTGMQVYVLGARAASLSRFGRDPGTGQLTFQESVPAHGKVISLSPDGQWLVVSGGESPHRGNGNPIELFRRDLSSGDLELSSTTPVAFLIHESLTTSGLRRRDGATFGPASSRLVYTEGGTFDILGWCPETPRPACRPSAKSRLLMKNKTSDTADQVAYRWQPGTGTPTTPHSAFGDVEVKSFTLCVYDANGPRFGVGLPSQVPRGTNWWEAQPLWKAYFDDWVYKDSKNVWNGVHSVRLRPDGQTRAYIKIQSKGENLGPLPTSTLSPPVTAQVVAADGECWESYYDASAVRRNVADASGITVVAKQP